MECQEIRELLSPYCDSMLEEALQNQVEQHLQHCEQCRQELEELQFVIKLMQGSTEVLAPAGFSGLITERLASLSPEQGKSNQSIKGGRVKTWFQTWGRVAAVAAILMLAVAIGLEQEGKFGFIAEQSKSTESSSPMAQSPPMSQDQSVGQLSGQSTGGSPGGSPTPMAENKALYKKHKQAALEDNSSAPSENSAVRAARDINNGDSAQQGLTNDKEANQSRKVAPGERKLITKGRLQLEVVNFDNAYSSLLKLVEKYQGYVENSSLSNSPSDTPLAAQYHAGRLTIRVPAGQFNALLAEIDKVGTVVFRETGNQDVSAEFYDTQARLRNWQQQEVRILEILKQAKNVEDILRVEGELQRVRQEIEVMEGRIKNLGSLTEMATLDIEISQVKSKKAIDLPEGRNVIPRATEAFIGTVNDLLNFMGKTIVLLGQLAPLLIILALAVGLWIILRYWKGRKPPSGE